MVEGPIRKLKFREPRLTPPVFELKPGAIGIDLEKVEKIRQSHRSMVERLWNGEKLVYSNTRRSFTIREGGRKHSNTNGLVVTSRWGHGPVDGHTDRSYYLIPRLADFEPFFTHSFQLRSGGPSNAFLGSVGSINCVQTIPENSPPVFQVSNVQSHFKFTPYKEEKNEVWRRFKKMVNQRYRNWRVVLFDALFEDAKTQQAIVRLDYADYSVQPSVSGNPDRKRSLESVQQMIMELQPIAKAHDYYLEWERHDRLNCYTITATPRSMGP